MQANVYQHWDSKQLHVMMRGSNVIRKLKKNYLMFLERIKQLFLFFKECHEAGAKVHLIICTHVPSSGTPKLEPLFRESEDIIGTLLKLHDFRDSLSGIQPSFLNISEDDLAR